MVVRLLLISPLPFVPVSGLNAVPNLNANVAARTPSGQLREELRGLALRADETRETSAKKLKRQAISQAKF